MLLKTKNTLNIRGKLFDLSTPVVMGILNVTPDSFYDGGRYNAIENAVAHAKKMWEDGAAIIDIGGASSRPGAVMISEDDETKRVLPLIEHLLQAIPNIVLSLDTTHPEVARRGLDAGVGIINDVSGGSEEMYAIASAYKAAYVLMHMRGNPQTMSKFTAYNDILMEMTDYFQIRMERLYANNQSDIIIDPGFGFSKNIEQNYYLLKYLSYFKSLNLPILVGISRKSMIYKTLNVEPEDSLTGTTVLNTIALVQGASILRVHDVKETVQAIKLYIATYNR